MLNVNVDYAEFIDRAADAAELSDEAEAAGNTLAAEFYSGVMAGVIKATTYVFGDTMFETVVEDVSIELARRRRLAGKETHHE